MSAGAVVYNSQLKGHALRLAGHTALGLFFVVVVHGIGNRMFWPFVWTYFIILADSFFRPPGAPEIRDNFRMAVMAFVLPLVVLPLASVVEAACVPHIYDTALRRCDLFLHLDGFALARFCQSHRILGQGLGLIYDDGLHVALPLAWLLGRKLSLWRGAVLGACLAFPAYLLCPAVGPGFVFTGWPGAHAVPAAHIPDSARNCMPSMHFTWALLAALNVPARWRCAFGAFALLTAISAIAVGQHYAVDMLAALPFTTLIYWLTMDRRN